MTAIFEDVVKLAEQLTPEQQNLLIYRLRVKQLQARDDQRINDPKSSDGDSKLVRAEFLHQSELLRQTPVKSEDQLLGKYA